MAVEKLAELLSQRRAREQAVQARAGSIDVGGGGPQTRAQPRRNQGAELGAAVGDSIRKGIASAMENRMAAKTQKAETETAKAVAAQPPGAAGPGIGMMTNMPQPNAQPGQPSVPQYQPAPAIPPGQNAIPAAPPGPPLPPAPGTMGIPQPPMPPPMVGAPGAMPAGPAMPQVGMSQPPAITSPQQWAPPPMPQLPQPQPTAQPVDPAMLQQQGAGNTVGPGTWEQVQAWLQSLQSRGM